MALKLRKSKNDPQIVQDLFKVHSLLNHGGKHWIKRAYHKFIPEKGDCYCLRGAAMEVAGRGSAGEGIALTTPQYRRYANIGTSLMNGIHIAFPRRRTNSITEFNDHPRTKWEDVEKVINAAIEMERTNGTQAS